MLLHRPRHRYMLTVARVHGCLPCSLQNAIWCSGVIHGSLCFWLAPNCSVMSCLRILGLLLLHSHEQNRAQIHSVFLALAGPVILILACGTSFEEGSASTPSYQSFLHPTIDRVEISSWLVFATDLYSSHQDRGLRVDWGIHSTESALLPRSHSCVIAGCSAMPWFEFSSFDSPVKHWAVLELLVLPVSSVYWIVSSCCALKWLSAASVEQGLLPIC